MAEDRPEGKGAYVVQQGEGISAIADAHGHYWQTIWDHPANADLQKNRANPEALLPGDRVTIPEKQPKWATCRTGQRHVFKRRGVPVRICLRLTHDKWEPLGGRRYELEVEGRTYGGTTDDDGLLEQWISTRARTAALRTWIEEDAEPWILDLQIGHLNPLETASGLRGRLENLGFDCGEDGEALSAAVRAFQQSAGLPATGALDGPTLDKLAGIYGGG